GERPARGSDREPGPPRGGGDRASRRPRDRGRPGAGRNRGRRRRPPDRDGVRDPRHHRGRADDDRERGRDRHLVPGLRRDAPLTRRAGVGALGERGPMSFVVTIDGPGAAGKSTTARAVAAQLGFLYLDTGALYRALALKVFENGISPDDRAAVE